MSFDPSAIVDVLQSHAYTSGLFEAVSGHEPLSPPSGGLTAAFWADYLGPVPAASSLDATTGLLIINARLYRSMLSEPQDAIDPEVLRATYGLMGAYSGNFSLGIVDAAERPAAWVDLLGQTRSRLESRAGYLKQDENTYRAMTITIPIVLPNLWPQAI